MKCGYRPSQKDNCSPKRELPSPGEPDLQLELKICAQNLWQRGLVRHQDTLTMKQRNLGAKITKLRRQIQELKAEQKAVDAEPR